MEINQIVSSFLGSNTYLVEKDNNVLLIDAGAELEKVIEAVGNKKVCGILLTHLHFDHVYYLKQYVQNYNCSVYLFDKNNVNKGNFTLSSLFGKLDLPTGVYESLNGKNNIEINGFNIECFYTPGHSADSMCFKIDNNLFSGDTLFNETIGRTDLPTSSVPDMLNSLEMLKNVEFETCYSGHGEPSRYAEQIDNIKYFIMEL